MRITAIAVDAFGVWSGLELADLSDHVNVFYGPNEAGKTTLLDFVRSILYGFSSARRARYLPPLHAGRPGGLLALATRDKSYTVARHDDDPTGADLPLVGIQGQFQRDSRALSAILGDIDESIFNNVFAIGLREIQELATLSDTQAAHELYNLALGGDRVSLLEVVNDLESSRNRLFAGDQGPSMVSQLLAERHRLQGELTTLSSSTGQYLELSAERRRLEAETKRLEAESAEAERQARELTLAQSLAERWQRRAAIESQLQIIDDGHSLPENALARFERVVTRIAARRHHLRRAKRAGRKLQLEINQLPVNEALCRQALRLEALGEQQPWISSLAERLARLDAESHELDTQRLAVANELKPFVQVGTVDTISKHDLADLRVAGAAMSNARRQRRAMDERIAAATQSAAQVNAQVSAALTAERDHGLTRSLTETGQLISQLRRRIQLDERIDQLSRRETELEAQTHEHLAEQMLPTWALAGLGTLFVLGCALVLLFMAGLVLPVSLTGALGWPLGLVGVGAAGAAAAIKFGLEHSAMRQLNNCQDQLDVLRQQLQDARQERDQLDAQLPKGGGPLVARLQAAEKTHARLEALLPLEATRDSAQREIDAMRRQHQTLDDAYRVQAKRWQQLLAQRRLPGNLTPKQLKSFSEHQERLRMLTARLDERKQELLARRAEYDALTGRIRQFAAEAGLASHALSPLDQLRQCLAALGNEQARQNRRDELLRQLEGHKRRCRQESQLLDRWRRRRHRMLQAAGAIDEVEFRRLAQVQAESHALRVEHARLSQEIVSALANRLTESDLRGWLADAAGLDQRLKLVAAAVERIASQLRSAHLRLGELAIELKLLAEDRQLPLKRVELDAVDQRLRQTLARWRVLAVAASMLDSVRQYYEREHQPRALREASQYLERMTEGRYGRVWTPLGEHRLRVDDRDGNSLSVDVLSRGTREQLFLSLRLALASAYARRGIHLPLVLDDVLVNFDVARARATATVLRDFARDGHQILVFTCHEHIAKMFRQLKAEVRDLPVGGQVPEPAPEPVPVEPPRRAGRIRRDDPHPLPEPILRPLEDLAPLPEPILTAVAPWPDVIVATNWQACPVDFTYQTFQPASRLVREPPATSRESNRSIHFREDHAVAISITHFDDADAA